jgi:hypothetical protein
MRSSSFRFPLGFPQQEKQFFRFLGKARQHNFSPTFAHKESTKPFIVLLRVLREGHWPKFFATSGSTPAPTLGPRIGWKSGPLGFFCS